MQRFGVASTSILRRLVRFSYRVKIQIRIVLLYINPNKRRLLASKLHHQNVMPVSMRLLEPRRLLIHIMFESYLNTYMLYQP